jgi:hypothetical protein
MRNPGKTPAGEYCTRGDFRGLRKSGTFATLKEARAGITSAHDWFLEQEAGALRGIRALPSEISK